MPEIRMGCECMIMIKYPFACLIYILCVTVFESATKINLPLVFCHHGPFKKKEKKINGSSNVFSRRSIQRDVVDSR